MGTLTHFYHVYADGGWHEPATEHVQALQQSGLADKLDRIYIGYVGAEHKITEAEQYLSSALPAVTIASSPSGWEQETMRHIPEYLTDGPVLYAHTKGASAHRPINIAWRRSMTKECIINWAECVRLLDVYDTVGCHWLQSEVDGRWFFGGTFWWATTEYLKTLPPVGESNRFEAENWIGLNPNVRQYDLKPGHPGNIPLDTDWRT